MQNDIHMQPAKAVETCKNCRLQLDLTDVAPLTIVECPVCKQAMEVLKKFGPFELQRILGKGGMGAVYKAVDLTLKRPVALKVLQSTWSSNRELTAQFEREASLTARINHPNVVRVYSTGVAYGMFYIAMELVDKGALDTKMDAVGMVPEEEVLQTCMQVAEGLAAAHRAGLIHRDIKPGNILFGEQNQAKIVDFGLALMSAQSTAGAGELWGTPYYIAPEALEGRKEDFRSDMYALGASMWHSLVGAPPHSCLSTSMPELLASKRTPVDLRQVLPSVHPFTAAALNKTIAFDPDQRYPDYESLIADLRHALAGLRSGGDSVAPVRSMGGGKMIAVTAACAVALVAIAALISPRSRNTDVAVVEEAGSTDESRLQSALKSIAKGRIEAAVKSLDLVSKSQALSGRMRVLSKAALGLSHSLAGKKPLFTSVLEELDSLDLKDEPEWGALAKALADAGAKASAATVPNQNAEREALRQFFVGLSAISRADFLSAKAALDLAENMRLAQGDPEVGAILGLVPDVLREVELVLKVTNLAAEASASNDPAAILKEAESAAVSIHVAPVLRSVVSAKVSQIKKAVSDATAAAKERESKTAEKTKAPATEGPQNPATADPAPTAKPTPAPTTVSTLSKASPAFVAARTKAMEQFQSFLFKEGIREARSFVPASDSDRRRQKSLIDQLTSAQSLFEWVVADINRLGGTPAAGRVVPVMRNGSPFQSVPAAADALELKVQVAGSAMVPIKWDKLSPLFLLKWLQARVASVPLGPQRAELLWGGANLSLLMNSIQNAEAFSKEAAKSNPDYTRIFEEMREQAAMP
jgi:serine/threonine protein kinase